MPFLYLSVKVGDKGLNKIVKSKKLIYYEHNTLSNNYKLIYYTNNIFFTFA